MKLGVTRIDEIISTHRQVAGQVTMPRLDPLSLGWEEPTRAGQVEEYLGRWLEAAEALASRPYASVVWAYAMRPWLETLIDCASVLGGDDVDAEGVFARMTEFWEANKS